MPFLLKHALADLDMGLDERLSAERDATGEAQEVVGDADSDNAADSTPAPIAELTEHPSDRLLRDECVGAKRQVCAVLLDRAEGDQSKIGLLERVRNLCGAHLVEQLGAADVIRDLFDGHRQASFLV